MKTVDEIKEAFRKIGIIPVVVLDDEEQAEPLAEALLRGGLPAAEVTFRTDAAAASIRRMKEKYPELLVGQISLWRYSALLNTLTHRQP
jgi:2-keto-3-deoxy-6-phosphogluconate aldolase